MCKTARAALGACGCHGPRGPSRVLAMHVTIPPPRARAFPIARGYRHRDLGASTTAHLGAHERSWRAAVPGLSRGIETPPKRAGRAVIHHSAVAMAMWRAFPDFGFDFRI